MLSPKLSHAAALLLLTPQSLPAEALLPPCRSIFPVVFGRSSFSPDDASSRVRRRAPALRPDLSALPPSADLPALILSPETVLPPLNASTDPWLRSLVWTDFRIAVSLFVAAPLVLLVWSVVACRPASLGGPADRPAEAEVVLRYLTGYWQASSLLLITVVLNVQESPLGAATGLFAQAMIVASLWWWSDLNDEIDAAASLPRPSALPSAFASWRPLATAAASTGVAAQVPFQPCAVLPSSLADDPQCAAWLEPPRFAAELAGVAPSTELGLVASAAGVLYAGVLAYYAAVLLPKVGRKGRAARPGLMDAASPIGAWRALGFIEGQTSAREDDA